MPLVDALGYGSFEVEVGKRLVLALEDAGVDVMHRCGGKARCTTCRVDFLEGEPSTMTEAERERLEARGLLGVVRLSCQVRCDENLSVRVLMTASGSGFDSQGPRPAEELQPPPVIVAAPPHA